MTKLLKKIYKSISMDIYLCQSLQNWQKYKLSL